MSPNNTGYTYQRPQHPALQGHNVQSFTQQQQQGAVNNYGGGRTEYATQQRWPDYGTSQHQYAPNTQQVPSLPIESTRVRGAVSRVGDIDMSSGDQAGTSRTATASSSSSSGFSEGYDQYTGATIQNYQPQVPTTTTAIGTQGGSRTVTASSHQGPFSGYSEYTVASQVQNYQQSQPATTTVEMSQQYRTTGGAPQQRQQHVAEYFDCTPPSTTSAPNYTSLYQTTDNTRQNTQATSASMYASMYQTANPTSSSHETTSAQSYDGTYQTTESQQRQQQTVQYQPPRTVTPIQQNIKQQRQSQQQQYPAPSVLVQHTQYETFSPPITHRTPTPSSTTISEASYSSAVSYQATLPQLQSQIQTHVTPAQLQVQRESQGTPSQPPFQSLPSVPQPSPLPQQPMSVAKHTKPKPKSTPRPKKSTQQGGGGLRTGTWNSPITMPSTSGVQDFSMPAIYKQALSNPENLGNASNVKGWIAPTEETPDSRVVSVDMMGGSQSIKTWSAPATAIPPAPRVVGVHGAASQQPQTRDMQRVLSEQRVPNVPQQEQKEQSWKMTDRQREQIAQQAANLEKPQRQEETPSRLQSQAQAPQYHQQQHKPEPQYASQTQHQHKPEPQYPSAQTRTSYQPPPQPTTAYSQPSPQDAPPMQPRPKHDSPQPQPQPPSRAPSDPRPAPPLNKDLMEQQMKIMVERMRYYQAADPITFQQVWDNVRKNGGATGGAITNGSAGGASNSGTVMARDGSIGGVRNTGGGGSGSSGGERRAIMDTPGGSGSGATPQIISEATSTSRTQPQQIQQPTQVQHQSPPQLVPPPETISAPASVPTVKPSPPQTTNAPPPPPPVPKTPQHHAITLKTAKAISKYLIKTSGHCLPEEVILELLDRINNFPILCDKLEAMGYKFHRGNFSRFLLAEVEGEGEDEVVVAAAAEVDVDMNADDGESRVLGEVGDDQEQIIRELNEARNTASSIPEPTSIQVPSESTVSPPNLESAAKPVKRGRGRPKKSISTTSELQVAKELDNPTTKTSIVSTDTTINPLPTPMYTARAAPINQPEPVAPLYDESMQQSPPSLENVSLNSKPDDAPRQPTPQKAYRPQKSPRMIIDLDSPPPPYSHEIEQSPVDVDMLNEEAPGEVGGLPQSLVGDSPKSSLIKLRLSSGESNHNNIRAATPPPLPTVLPFSKGVTIDLTSSAIPEPQIERAHQPPATAPQFRGAPQRNGKEWKNYSVKALPPAITQPILDPIPIPIPQSAPAKQHVAPSPAPEVPLYKPISKKDALIKLLYNPATIARDIMIATGRSADIRPLNAHLDGLRTGRAGLVSYDADLETIRWDIIDPDPFGYGDDVDGSDGGFGGMADDEGEGSGVGGPDIAVARTPAISRNPTIAKGMVGAIAPSPTPVGRGRPRKRGSILGASIKDFENSGQGVITASGSKGSNNSNSGTPGRKSVTNNSRGNGGGNGDNSNGGGSWGGFTAPTPRSNSRTGSGLRNVVTPDVPSRNFQVVIRSPSVSSVDRNRPEPPNPKTLKRKLDDSDKEKGTPATKKGARSGIQRPESASKVTRKGKARVDIEEGEDDELKPSGFKVFKCKWKYCSAELHNFETLHRHVIKAHCKLAEFGGYPCKWEGCTKSPTKEMKAIISAKKGGPSTLNHTWDFKTPEQWEKHIMASHLDSIRNELGVGPSVGPYDREAVGSDVDYLSDSHGRRITPIARPAPSGYIFLPPLGYLSPSDPNRYTSRARTLGAGMEGNESADLRSNDDGEGIFIAVRRIVGVEDGALGVLGSVGASILEKPSSDEAFEAAPGIGAFTVHDE